MRCAGRSGRVSGRVSGEPTVRTVLTSNRRRFASATEEGTEAGRHGARCGTTRSYVPSVVSPLDSGRRW